MKKFRQIMSAFLLGVMLFNYCTPFVHAEEVDTPNKIASSEKFEGVGNIETEIHLLLPIRNREKTGITYKIYNAKGQSASVNLDEITDYKGLLDKSIILGSQKVEVKANKRDTLGNLLTGIDYNNNIVYYSINVYGLTKGEYKIEMSGNNFVTYQTSVNLDKFSKRINITNEKGLFEIGDINKDNKVDDSDTNLMLDAIVNNDNKYDLNLDGKTDIADLNYITAIINGDKKSVKPENTSAIIDSEVVNFELTSETEVEGNLSSIFNDTEVVTLKRSDDKEVSEDNPINLTLDLGTDKNASVDMSQIRIAVGDNAPKKTSVVVEFEDGTVKTYEGKVKTNESSANILYFTDESEEGTIIVDLGKQVAVKKVTIKITETGSNNLADIAKVEFLNNVKVETREPEGFGVPTNVKVDNSVSEQLTVTYQNPGNVTGYEIRINGPKMDNVIFQTTYTTFTIEDLKNYETYKIAVRAINQEWQSKWSDEVIGSPEANRLPPKPDMVKLTPTYSGFEVSWKDMDDTTSYNLYYKEVDDTKYTKISDISKPSYSLKGLKAAQEYEIYITGNNKKGEGEGSNAVKGKTLKAEATITPKYKLINKTIDGKTETDHIKNVVYTSGEMFNGEKFSMVDDNYLSYWELKSWNVASSYYNIGVPITVLDKAYTMDEFVITVPDSYPYSYKSGTYDTNVNSKNDALVHYWKSETDYKDTNKTTVQAVITQKKDENNRTYYLVKLQEPITAQAIQFGLTVSGNANLAQVAEVKFYEYDSLVDDVAKLFTDDLRVELADGVNQAKIDELRKRADVMDNGEYNPYRESILNDLKYAEDILNDKALNDIITLNPNISNSYNGHLGFAMTINDYQPLGVVAKAGSKLTVYIGTTASTVNAELVFTQYHAEANAWSKTVKGLKKGQNIIDVPQIVDTDVEKGGSVYIRYSGTPNANAPIKVRVSGGVKIPVLDTTKLTSESEKKEAIKNYINALDTHIESIKKTYGDSFDPRSSVEAATEIATRQGLFSVAAVAVKDALDSGCNTLDEKVERLYNSVEAFDEMIDLFYRQKGLSESASDPKDAWPKSRINIRYMQMFDGAFMYAGGYHIGIEYGSIGGLVQGKGNSDNGTGYFGWGISHEVGHQINQGALVHAEVTNNIYALLAQTSNDKDLSRLEVSNIYPKIYEKVTSHTAGKAQNVFVQLGMYWQLHLAYDNNKTFEDADSIYARINHLTRTFNNKDESGQTLFTSKDDLLVLYASMAAKKDLTEFFELWGLRPTDKVKTYIKDTLKLEKETRAIWYLNDAARRYRLNNGEAITNASVTAKISEVDNKNKEVTINLGVTSESDKILGYEIIRNGESIAFVEGNQDSYIDRVGSENNRAYTYKVVAYDYLLNKTKEVVLDEIKISYDGSIASKDTFSIESNFKAKGEVVDLEDSDMDYKKLTINNLIDGKANSSFVGDERIQTLTTNGDKVSMTTDSNDAYVIINLNDKYALSGIKYQALVDNGKLDANTISKFRISVSTDKENWTVAREGTFNLTEENNYTDIVYFLKEGTDSETGLWTYNDISYVKIESVGNKKGISGVEIDIIAPPGDNIDITVNNGIPNVGILDKDYTYDASLGDEGIIKAGSVIIQGEYRGSPSFNIVTITDAYDNSKIYDGYQLLFAELNSDMSVYDVAKGTWMYIMSEEEYNKMLKDSKNIRANLYRVNDAITLDD